MDEEQYWQFQWFLGHDGKQNCSIMIRVLYSRFHYMPCTHQEHIYETIYIEDVITYFHSHSHLTLGPVVCPSLMQEERLSLANLYFATNGEGWLRSDEWLTGDHHCVWKGVVCNSDGYVDRLNLSWNELKGPIPDSIGNLKNLNYLDLSFNHIPIPVG